MADEQGAVIIRDAAGTEHEFPAGFDPVKAGEIVRQQTTPAATSGPRNARGTFATSSDTSDGPAPEASSLMALLDPYAHPETLTDFARILTLPVDSVRRALGAALATSAAKSVGQSVGGAVTAAKNLASRVRVNPQTAFDEFSLVQPQKVLKGVSLGPATPEMMTPGYDRYLPSQSGYVAPAPAAAAPVAAPIAAQVAPVAAAPVAAEVAPVAAEPVVVARAARPQLVPRPPPVAAEPLPPGALTSDPTRASGAALPDQKALNEAALAVRRAAYQASQGKPVSEVVKAVQTVAKDAKLKLTGDEIRAGMDLVKRGMSAEDALTAIVTQRDFLRQMPGTVTGAAAKAAVKARRYKS